MAICIMENVEFGATPQLHMVWTRLLSASDAPAPHLSWKKETAGRCSGPRILLSAAPRPDA